MSVGQPKLTRRFDAEDDASIPWLCRKLSKRTLCGFMYHVPRLITARTTAVDILDICFMAHLCMDHRASAGVKGPEHVLEPAPLLVNTTYLFCP